MGVNFKVLRATGICLNINKLQRNKKAFDLIERIRKEDFFNLDEQDNYGNSDGEARLIIYKKCDTLVDLKAGFTPFEFIATQVYNPSHETVVYGGARKYFAIETEWKEKKEKIAMSKKLLDELHIPEELREYFAEGYNNWIFSYYY